MFHFKQFTITQDQCAMKVGTDGILLGAWTSLNSNPKIVLDIGTGTGIIALMIAQRTHHTKINALEIDKMSYNQCVENFKNSPWNNNLSCYHTSLIDFNNKTNKKYDLVISNPPFYRDTFYSHNQQKNLARFEKAMPFNDLIKYTSILLADNGLFSVIIPYKEESEFISKNAKYNLFPEKITRVRGNSLSTIKRSLLLFNRESKSKPIINELIIETSRHKYTSEYINLTKDFYIKM